MSIKDRIKRHLKKALLSFYPSLLSIKIPFLFLKNSVKIALDAGISENKICLDGGIGFAKSREQNFELLNGYERLSSLGYPLLLGASRKSMFGGAVEDRLEPTLAATRLAVQKGVRFVRVHDVKENAMAIAIAQKNLRSR